MSPDHDLSATSTDDLDRFLDELVLGRPADPRSLEPDLAAAVIAVISSIETPSSVGSRPPDLDTTWAALLAKAIPSTPRSSRSRARVGIVAVSPAAPGWVITRHRTIWAAAIAALVVVALAVTLYDGLPGVDSTPTALAAGHDETSWTATAQPATCSPTISPPTRTPPVDRAAVEHHLVPTQVLPGPCLGSNESRP